MGGLGSWRIPNGAYAIGVTFWLLMIPSSVGLSAAGDARLAEAVKRRDREAARVLLAQRADVKAPLPDGSTALHWTAHRDDVETTDVIIRAGAAVDVADDYGVTPLLLAAQNGSVQMIDVLLKAGASQNLARPTGETPLMSAARTGRIEALKTLLARGAGVSAKETTRGQTPGLRAIPPGAGRRSEQGFRVYASALGGWRVGWGHRSIEWRFCHTRRAQVTA